MPVQDLVRTKLIPLTNPAAQSVARGLERSADTAHTWLQLCKAYAPEGGRTIVVLSQQPKLQMEANFRRTIPASQRFGTKLVFRQARFVVFRSACREALSAAHSPYPTLQVLPAWVDSYSRPKSLVKGVFIPFSARHCSLQGLSS